MLLLQFSHLTSGLFKRGLKGQPLHEDRLSCFHGDERMRHAFATAEQKSWPVLGIVGAHPAF